MKLIPSAPWASLSSILRISLALSFSITAIPAALINVDFNGGYFSLPNPTHNGPAVTGAEGDLWNGFDTTSGNGPHSLVDASGSVSNIELTFDYMAFIYYAGPTDLFAGRPYEDLMSAFASFQNGGTATATLTGFIPSSPYSLWVYTAGDLQSTDGGATWSVNGGPSQTNLFDAATSDFTLENNYLLFTGSTSDTGEIILSGTENGVEGFLNGLQVQATPAPLASFTVTAIARAASGALDLTFPTELGKNYTIESSPGMAAELWADTLVGTVGTGSPQTLTVPVQGAGCKWFFRVRKLGVSPAIPGNPVASATTSTTVLLTWTDVATESGYEVQWANNANFNAANSLGPVTANTTSANIADLTPNTAYFFRVRAIKSGANPSDYALAEATTPVPNSFPVVSVGGITDASTEPWGGEEAIYGTDGLTNTKWLGNMTIDGAWLRYTFADNLSKTIKGFKITTANDNPGRHPGDFRLQGSTDGGTIWVDIIDSSFSAQTAGIPFVTKDYNCVANNVSYPSVRLFISANNGDANTGLGGIGLVQLAEWEILGE